MDNTEPLSNREQTYLVMMTCNIYYIYVLCIFLSMYMYVPIKSIQKPVMNSIGCHVSLIFVFPRPGLWLKKSPPEFGGSVCGDVTLPETSGRNAPRRWLNLSSTLKSRACRAQIRNAGAI